VSAARIGGVLPCNYPFETIPSPILAGTVNSIAWLNYDGRSNRGTFFLSDVSGLPSIGVQAGLTRVVYDRTTRAAPSDAIALAPPSVQRNVSLPFGIVFLGRPWSEPQLIELAAAYERARGPRTPPPGFGPVHGEP
jgi:amidase